MSVLKQMEATLVGCHPASMKYSNTGTKEKHELIPVIRGFYRIVSGARFWKGRWIETGGYCESHWFFMCLHCGNIFEKSASYMLNHGHSRLACPRCRWRIEDKRLKEHDKKFPRISSGEWHVMKYLSSHNIPNVYGYICEHLRYNGHLHFDFWLPKYRIAIEYDGRQHFEPVNFFGGKKGFRLEKKRDHLKNRYCKKHHIKLIRIAYNQSIKKVLDEKLNRQLSLF